MLCFGVRGALRLRRPSLVLHRRLPAPFTCAYVLLLLGTSLYARTLAPQQLRRLLLHASTDAENLVHRPVFCLVASAVWIASAGWPVFLAAVAVTAGALERRIGALRTAVVFAAGHLTATLVSEAPFVLAYLTGGLEPGGGARLDVGVSYGVLCCAGALPALVRHPRRTVALGVAGMLWVSLGPDPLAAIGHPVAYLVGVLLWPTVRRWAADRSQRT
jgi:hypothetical protein